MARTKAQTIEGFQNRYATIDPSIDAYGGPIYDWIIDPISEIIAETEERQDHTDKLASADFSAAADEEELERMAATVGAGKLQGKAATGYVYMGSRSQPVVDVTIPKGSMVSTTDGKYVFQTLESKSLLVATVFSLYNPTKRTFEVKIPVEAIAVGEAYNLPPYRIKKIVSPITGIDFVENREYMRYGTDLGGTEDLEEKARNKLVGQEKNSPAGIAAAVTAAFENVNSVATITSADYDLFRRAISGPGIDFYYSGEEETEVVEEYTAVGGEVAIYPTYKPILSVTSVTINGLATSYTLELDDNPATMGSSVDSSRILFASALAPADLVTLRYDYDSLAESITDQFGGSLNSFFGTDVLFRRSIKKNPYIQLEAKADSGFDPFSLKTSIETYIREFFETYVHGEVYYPLDFKDYIKSNVVGIAPNSLVLVKFNLYGRAMLDIEPIELKDNETAEVDVSILDLEIQ